MLSPHFTIHLSGFVPSIPVNLFYKKFWALSSILDKNQDETKGFGVILWNLKEKMPGVELSQSSPSRELALSFFYCFVPFTSVVLSTVVVCCCGWRWPFFYLLFHQTKSIAEVTAVRFSANGVTFISDTELATLKWGQEPQGRSWLRKVVLSAAFGGRPTHAVRSYHPWIFNACSHISISLQPMETLSFN